MRDQGIEQRVVVAVHEATGTVAGLTDVIVLPHRPERCYQVDTAVLAAHRGHGLGLCIEANTARWLMSDRRGLERVETATRFDNIHMTRVNHQLGLTTLRTDLGAVLLE